MVRGGRQHKACPDVGKVYDIEAQIREHCDSYVVLARSQCFGLTEDLDTGLEHLIKQNKINTHKLEGSYLVL